jgi:hypothetical protein
MALVELERFNSRMEAELAHGYLHAAGIDTVVFSGDRGFGTHRLMVEAIELEQAIKALRQTQPPR